MKKINFILAITLIFGILLVGCTSEETTTSNVPENENSETVTSNNEENTTAEEEAKTDEKDDKTLAEENEQVMQVINKIEILDHSFANYGILYESYTAKLEGLFVQGEVPTFNEDAHLDLSYISSAADVKVFTEEQRKTAKEGNEKKVAIEISNVFDDEARNWKYVFTKSTILDPSIEEGDQILIIYRRYLLTSQDGNWRILSIDQFKCGKDTPQDKINYNKFNNELVEFVDTILFAQ